MKSVVAIVGPSASGKDSVVGRILKEEYGIPELISTTSRAKRKGEKEGVDYYFIEKSDKLWDDKSAFVELVEYNDNFYGLTVEEVEKQLLINNIVFCIVDIQGLCLINEKLGSKYNVVSIFVDVSSNSNVEEKLKIIKKRMVDRGDTPENIESRLRYVIDNREFYNNQYCDYTVINDNTNNAKRSISKILEDMKGSV